jgi:hypothetical protein
LVVSVADVPVSNSLGRVLPVLLFTTPM